MKIITKKEVITVVAEEIDITFPYYRYLNSHSDHGEFEYYYRIDLDPSFAENSPKFKLLEISKTRSFNTENYSYEISIYNKYPTLPHYNDKEITEIEFNEAKNEIIALLGYKLELVKNE